METALGVTHCYHCKHLVEDVELNYACQLCHAASYCTLHCKRCDWRSHRAVCRQLQGANERKLPLNTARFELHLTAKQVLGHFRDYQVQLQMMNVQANYVHDLGLGLGAFTIQLKFNQLGVLRDKDAFCQQLRSKSITVDYVPFYGLSKLYPAQYPISYACRLTMPDINRLADFTVLLDISDVTSLPAHAKHFVVSETFRGPIAAPFTILNQAEQYRRLAVIRQDNVKRRGDKPSVLRFPALQEKQIWINFTVTPQRVLMPYYLYMQTPFIYGQIDLLASVPWGQTSNQKVRDVLKGNGLGNHRRTNQRLDDVLHRLVSPRP